MPRLRVVTWNINSVRLRLEQAGRLIAESGADILCLQELKCAPDKLPLDALATFGLPHIRFAAEKGYNGVMALSRYPLTPLPVENWGGKGDARHLGVHVALPDRAAPVRLDVAYVPAGGDDPDPDANPKFRHKLDFLSHMTRWAQDRPADEPRIILGDLNIAPLESDVWSHRQLLSVVSHTPIETDGLNAFQTAGGWIDTTRHIIPEPERVYSWWSYRARDWAASDRGRRLDHIWATAPLAQTLTGAGVMREVRSWEKPSDHAPVWADFKI